MAEVEPEILNSIPETIFKKRKNNEEWALRRKLQLAEKTKIRATSFTIKKPEQFIREYRDREMDLVQMKNRKKQYRRSMVIPESKLLFVIRIGGKNDLHPNTRKILYALRLRRIFSGVFVKSSKNLMEILKKVEPYITYGYPNLKSVKDLIYKKGVGKFERQKVPLTDNNIIEQVLGEHNILCIEDIVNEIATVGPQFEKVSSFLCPFNLDKPEKALQGKKKRFTDGGDSGDRGDQINELILKLN
ncbi:OLC1v1014600C1 [Oldenlandia corymbosa var. corymbosa]|uniref:OLC1v1014600C1 n=1 Tax=Oldenlandia corymbosa var. corymbosa TaxID=529605 RepID=A0AAV1E171_OLDCO|nr:OLC1v1014600C1 [Oldenlandia corymbosa var. corymbosa]